MSWSPGAIAIVRALNAAFFLLVSAYCLLCYTPFAYFQFIKPHVLEGVNDFIVLTPWLFWLALLATILTLMPQLRGSVVRGRLLVRVYVGVSLAVGAWVAFRAPLSDLGNTGWAFALGMLALLPPLWLSLIDHVAHEEPATTAADPFHLVLACLVGALAAWAVYALGTPARLREAVGVSLTVPATIAGLAASLVVTLFAFMAAFLAFMAAAGLAGWTRRPGVWMYRLSLGLLAGSTTFVFDRLVCASLAFSGWAAWVASAGLALTAATVWADLARLRAARAAGGNALDALALFSAPAAGITGRTGPAAVLILLPIAAYELSAAVAHIDWDFLLQKLAVLAVWLAAFTSVYALLGTARLERRRQRSLVVAAPIVVLCLFIGSDWVQGAEGRPSIVLDRYAALDPSFRLVRDARTVRSADTAEYYDRLRGHTLLAPRQVRPPRTGFVEHLTAVPGRKPDIFLIVIDSLRRDYVSPFNRQVTFTPEIAKLAADGFAFERTFTRYSGTGLAVPSIWAGGMVVHMVEQPSFDGRNALLRLLEANDYVRFMDMDNIVSELMPGDDPQRVVLDRGRTSMQFDLCRTFDELEDRLTAAGTARPSFFYALPQNVHIAVASKRAVPAGEAYPGFFPQVASSVRRVDGCIGGFVDYLKRSGRYDNSVVIVTSDHGDALGEEGRWGHAYFVIPEVMRVPLVVHLPSRLKARVSADLSAVSFTVDLTPTLYALLGYTPADCGTLCGHPLFVSPETDTSWRRRQPFLLASSYGAVYAMLRQNGQRLYVVDAVDGRDDAFDLGSEAIGRRLGVTGSMTKANRTLILQQLSQVAALYGYREP